MGEFTHCMFKSKIKLLKFNRLIGTVCLQHTTEMKSSEMSHCLTSSVISFGGKKN